MRTVCTCPWQHVRSSLGCRYDVLWGINPDANFIKRSGCHKAVTSFRCESMGSCEWFSAYVMGNALAENYLAVCNALSGGCCCSTMQVRVQWFWFACGPLHRHCCEKRCMCTSGGSEVVTYRGWQTTSYPVGGICVCVTGEWPWFSLGAKATRLEHLANYWFCFFFPLHL